MEFSIRPSWYTENLGVRWQAQRDTALDLDTIRPTGS
jgi:hypothetical protein